MTSTDNKSPPTDEAKEQDNTTQSDETKEPTTQLNASNIKSLAPPSSSSSSNEPKKKRRSDIQLNKDDHPEGDNDEHDDDLNEDGEKRSDPFKKASEEVMKGRKIVKVSKKWDTGAGIGGGGGGGGVFGSVALVADSSNAEKKDDNATAPSASESVKVQAPTFGSAAAKSGFGTFGSGFGAVSNGFGSLKPKSDDNGDKKDGEENDTPKSTFGSGFGASAGFGNVKSTTSSGFGNTGEKEESAPTSKTDNESGAFTASTTTTEKIVMTSTELNNGEENFDCICEVRAKLHKLLPVEDEDEEAKEEKGEKVASVPSTSGRLELKANEKTEGSNNDGNGTGKISLSWKEAGIGPVRVLNPKEHLLSKVGETSKLHPRLVQRQESAPGSQGMKVILNVNLIPDVCKVTRTSEKIVQLNAPNVENDGSGRALESYSLRVKTEEEANKLQDALKKMLASS